VKEEPEQMRKSQGRVKEKNKDKLELT